MAINGKSVDEGMDEWCASIVCGGIFHGKCSAGLCVWRTWGKVMDLIKRRKCLLSNSLVSGLLIGVSCIGLLGCGSPPDFDSDQIDLLDAISLKGRGGVGFIDDSVVVIIDSVWVNGEHGGLLGHEHIMSRVYARMRGRFDLDLEFEIGKYWSGEGEWEYSFCWASRESGNCVQLNEHVRTNIREGCTFLAELPYGDSGRIGLLINIDGGIVGVEYQGEVLPKTLDNNEVCHTFVADSLSEDLRNTDEARISR